MPRHCHRRKNRPSWLELTRSQRKRRFIAVKNAIRQRSAYFRGLYDTSDALTPGRGWIDLVFLSRKHKGSYYNVTLETAFCRFHENLSDRAWDNTSGPDRGPDFLSDCSVSVSQRDQRQAAFEGEMRRLADSGALAVRESVRIDRSYSAGIGLIATINAAYLSPEVVERFVLDFLDSGEAEWQGSEDLSWPANDATGGLFINPVGNNLADEPWARELLIRNRARDEQAALAAAIDAAPSAPGASGRGL